MPTNEESLFLSDQAITEEEEDQFGHVEYVDSLERMLKEAEPPWHIGIFGEWGAGKSSIIKLLFNRLRADPDFEDTIFVEFDAWSHAEESIRTELLIELDQKIGGENSDGVLGEDEITSRLYDVEEEEIEGENPGIWVGFIDFITGETHLALITLALVVISALFAFFEMPEVSIGVLTLILAPLFVSMAQRLSDATDTLQRKFLYPRKEWSGAFQRIFEDIIAQSGAEKVVISVDNLDRCQSEVVLDVLVSLKTFMENDRCIYLIPCDDEALESHIRAIDEGEYFEASENEREFLRKFFQTHIRIPPFLPEDIEKYAEYENARLSEKFESDTLDVLTNAYIDNPRRIKHALNRLTTLRILAEEIEDSGNLSPKRITGNIPFLAKISILEEEYSTFYREITQDPHLLEDVNQYFTGQLDDSSRKNRVRNLLKSDDRNSDEPDDESRLESFLRSTRRIRADNPKPFLNLSEPSYATSVSDVDVFLQNLRTGQEEEVREELEKVDSFVPYVTAIENTIEEYTTKRRAQPLFGTIDTVAAIFDEFDDQSKEKIAEIYGEYLTTEPGKSFLVDLEPVAIFAILEWMGDRRARTLFDEYADLVTQDGDFRSNILTAFTEYVGTVPSGTSRRLARNLEELDADSFKAALKVLKKSREVKSKFTYTSTLEKAASLVELQDNQNEFQETEHYSEFDNTATKSARAAYVERLLDLREDYQGNQAQEMDKQLAEELLLLETGITQDTGERLFEEISNLIDDRNNQEPMELVEVCFHFYDSFPENTQEEFHDWLGSILSSWNGQNIEEIFEFGSVYDVSVFETEAEVNAVLDRIPNNISNEGFIIGTVVPAIPRKFEGILLENVEQLIRNNDANTNRLGISIFSDQPEKFEDIWRDVIEVCGNHANGTNNTNHKREYMEVGANIFADLDAPIQESYISQMERLLSGNHDDYQLYREVWNQIRDDTDADRKEAIAGDVREELAEAVSRNQNPDHLDPLIGVFQSLTDYVGNTNGQRLMERMSKQLTENNLNENQKGAVIAQLATFEEFFEKEDQILDRLENLLSQTNNDNVLQGARELIDRFEKLDAADPDRLKKIREEHLNQ